MRHWLSTLTLNQKLALGTLVLGAVAIFAVPYPGATITLDAREVGLIIGRDADQIAAPELAAWIIESRSDYRLVDLRSDAEFARYHIPTAAHVPVGGLTTSDLGRHEKIVVYAGDPTHSAQAWMLLKARGYKGVYILKGDLEAWKDDVVFPVISDNPSPAERLRDDRARAVSAHFGGQPRSASAVASGGTTLAMPSSAAPAKVAAPASPAGGAKPKAKKREGC